MKDAITVWNRFVGRTYAAVSTNANVRDQYTDDDCPSNSPRNVAFRVLNGKYKSAFTIAFVGMVGILMGLFIVAVHPYDILFKWKCVFSDGGEIFELWRNPPVDLYLKVYLWNVTNKDAFLRGEEKLRVQEVGPYVYKELMTHENITFNENGTVTAVPKHPLVWVPELSEGRTEDDQLILPNIALLSIAQVVSEASYFTRLGLNLIVRQTKSEPLVQMSAKEFMFGYKSTLMTLGNQFMPSWIYFDKLGLIDRMYDFEGDYETVYTGENDIARTGLIDTYIGSTKIPQWEEPCGTVRGASDGTKFPGSIKPNDTLYFFRKSMCRAKPLIRINETENAGLSAYVYTFPNNTDDNGRLNSNNTCFCNDKDNCLPVGLLDVKGCYYGFPIALSYPHFYLADKSLIENVEGSNPDPAKHASFFVIQPDSGLPLELAARYQINMALGNIDNVANVERFSNMILPMLWTEIRLYGLPDILAARFRLYLNVLPTVEQGAMYFFFFMGSMFLIYAVYKALTSRQRVKPQNIPWIDEEVAINADRKMSNYKPDKRSSMSAKELEVYFNSLCTPLNQEITFEDFQDMKEEDV